MFDIINVEIQANLSRIETLNSFEEQQNRDTGKSTIPMVTRRVRK